MSRPHAQVIVAPRVRSGRPVVIVIIIVALYTCRSVSMLRLAAIQVQSPSLILRAVPTTLRMPDRHSLHADRTSLLEMTQVIACWCMRML